MRHGTEAIQPDPEPEPELKPSTPPSRAEAANRTLCRILSDPMNEASFVVLDDQGKPMMATIAQRVPQVSRPIFPQMLDNTSRLRG